MTREEREKGIIECFKKGMRYQETANFLGLNKNDMYHARTCLLKSGQIIRVGTGQYALPDGPIPEYVPSKRKPREPKLAKVIEIKPPQKDGEEIATNLLEKIGSLKPLLGLHINLFNEIEKITLELVQYFIESKPYILTKKQMEEFNELKEIKERAQKIAEQKSYKIR